MGGSGGGRWISDADLNRLTEEARRHTETATQEAEVNQLLSEELHEINRRDTDLVNTRLDEMVDELSEVMDEIDRLVFGGSVSKHTFVNGISDVDALVLLKAGADLSPARAREQFAGILRETLGNRAEVEVGNLAVTVRYQDGLEIQLLPAVQRGEARAISSPNGKEWVEIRPHRFAQALTRANQELDGRVVPSIKLAKAIIAGLPEESRPSGYHVEALALAAYDGYIGAKDLKSMVTRFFDAAADHINRPIADVTGQSQHIDAELGPAGSAQRQVLSTALRRIASQMESGSSDTWKAFFE